MFNLPNKKVIIGLIALAILIYILKLFWLPITDKKSPLQTKLTINYEVTKTVINETEIQLPLPYSTRKNRLVSQSMSYNGWRIIKRNYKDGDKRGIILIATEKRPSTIQLQYNFSHLDNAQKRVATPLKAAEFDKYTKLDEFDQKRLAKFNQYLAKNAFNPEKLLESDSSLPKYLEFYESYWGAFPNYQSLKNKPCNNWLIEQNNLLTNLRILNIPIRTVCGITVDIQNNSYKRGWLEFHDGDYWQVLDLWSDNTLKLIAFSKDSNKYSSIKNGSKLKETFSVDNVLIEEIQKFNIEKFYNLELLPLDIQDTLKILLTLPFAVLITAFLKAFLRIETFGTLTPALLGLALAFNEILLSFIILTFVFFPTIYVKKLVQNKNKIVEHTVTLTFVILVLIFILTLADTMGWIENPSDALLPVIILTLLIDKYFTALNKTSVNQANIKMVYTLLLTFIVIGVLQLSFIGDWFLVHPEMHLVTIALALILCKPKESKDVIEEPKTDP